MNWGKVKPPMGEEPLYANYINSSSYLSLIKCTREVYSFFRVYHVPKTFDCMSTCSENLDQREKIHENEMDLEDKQAPSI